MTQDQWNIVKRIDEKVGGRIIGDMWHVTNGNVPILPTDDDAIAWRLMREIGGVSFTQILNAAERVLL